MPVDVSGLLRAFDGLSDLQESLARRMGVSGGVVIRDAAIENAPVGDEKDGYAASWKTGSTEPGALKEAIYLAYNESQSNDQQIVYSVSWNAKKAFWGVFIEFGFIMDHLVGMNPDGTFWTDKSKKRPKGALTVDAQPFLAPALDNNIQRIVQATLDRGKQEFPKLLQEIKK